MNDEEIENQLEERKTLDQAGFMNPEHFEEHRYHAYMGLIKFGGSFSKALGHTLSHADRSNSMKILRYWQHDCEKHAMLNKMYEAKMKAEAAES